VLNTGKRQNVKQYDRVYIQLHSIIKKQTGVKLDKQHGYEQVTSDNTSHKSYLALKIDKTLPQNKLENLVLDSGKGAC
jgi:hypothetical protein